MTSQTATAPALEPSDDQGTPDFPIWLTPTRNDQYDLWEALARRNGPALRIFVVGR